MKRILWRLAFMVVAVLVVFALYRLLTINPPPPTRFLESPYPLNMAHRGGAALAPENTMLAFQNALALGADVLELDVRASRDGELVVIHDETVDRTTDGTGKVTEMTLAQLQALDAGYRYSPDNGHSFPYRGRGIKIPTLREVLTAFPEARVNIEIKQVTPPIEETVARLIEEMGAQDRVLVVASDDGVIKRFRRLMPGIATGASAGEVQSFYLLQRFGLGAFYRPVANALQVPDRSGEIQVVTPRFVAAAHAQGMKVHVWTINTPDRMRQLLQMGVDGIITDRPDLLRQVMAEVLAGSSRK
ncbi:MAG: glycerophosphodiester phosphodiesterase [Anaerolineae bacterium]|nr:glycerophosphodiester phosphodiesterase [Anaerolineae bacterium]MDW8099499.1 glycerophosphodiester phosphodiesterase [Anaerolineae bacterium]